MKTEENNQDVRKSNTKKKTVWAWIILLGIQVCFCGPTVLRLLVRDSDLVFLQRFVSLLRPVSLVAMLLMLISPLFLYRLNKLVGRIAVYLIVFFFLMAMFSLAS